jgi:hypothetical protein
MGEQSRLRQALFLRHEHYVRIAAKACQRKNILADPGTVRILADSVYDA